MGQVGRGGHRYVQLHDFRASKVASIGDSDGGIETEFAVQDHSVGELQVRIREGGVGETVTDNAESGNLLYPIHTKQIAHPNENCGFIPLLWKCL